MFVILDQDLSGNQNKFYIFKINTNSNINVELDEGHLIYYLLDPGSNPIFQGEILDSTDNR